MMEVDNVVVNWEDLVEILQVPEKVVRFINANTPHNPSKSTSCHYLKAISSGLFHPLYTINVAKSFHPILLDLLTRGAKEESQISVFIALSKLVGYYPEATEFAYRLYGGKVNRILPDESNTEPMTKKLKTEVKESHTEEILSACLAFLWFDPDFYVQAFDWSNLGYFRKHENPRVRFLTLQCLRVVTLLSETDVYEELQDESTLIKMRIDFHHLFKSRQSSTYNEFSTQAIMSFFDMADFCEELVCIQGVLIPKHISSSKPSQASHVVMTESFKESLKSLAKCVVSSQPVIVEGPVGAGKTTLVEHLASLTGRSSAPHLTKVQLGDQIDSKVLIGGHVCTEIPGEFLWRSGPLTSAMTEGNWLLFEDIDSASPDVLSTIAAALKSRSLLSLPGCTVMTAVNGNFRIFFTRRTHSGRMTPVMHSEIDRLAQTVKLTNQSIEEIRQMILELFPSLERVVNAVVQTYKVISGHGESDSLRSFSERNVSTRDVIKWCKRLSSRFSGKGNISAEFAFKDALDCFIPNPEENPEKYELLGSHLNISRQDASRLALFDPHEPDFYGPSGIQFGRVSLPRKKRDKLLNKQRKSAIFAFTRPSLNLLERIAASLASKEPVLLVGETGTGKTSTVQYLANQLGHDLVVVNLNQQSDSCDLIGGYKPVEVKIILEPLRQNFDRLVRITFAGKDNEKFLEKVKQCLKSKKYQLFLQLVKDVHQKADVFLSKKDNCNHLRDEWQEIKNKVDRLSSKLIQENKKSIMAFAFVEGSLVHAMKTGQWILLDEINLAESETLQSLSAVLESNDKPVIMPDKVDGEAVPKHPDFRIFACMNPATDVGKRDLPLGIRNRFTEFYVTELEDEKDLRKMVREYLPSSNCVESIVKFYKNARKEAATSLSDTTGHHPHYSLRTLCRALSVAARNPCEDMTRSLYESFCLSFLTQLSSKSRTQVERMIAQEIIGDNNRTKAVISKQIPEPQEEGTYLQFEGFWLKQGNLEPVEDSSYILTNTIRKNLKDLARILSIGSNFPVLLQGETSVGKTSLIQYLAKATGNVCRRINNHEHTDLEEYVGCYCSDENGNLVFKEGVLVEAMRKGYWFILDELNLAPTEVLEALNRVLDDNRELFIPESQTTVKAHPGFQLFATQNPPGLYGGRKLLSRAFRNRFVELHFDEIPKSELTTILEKRCLVPLTYAKKMVTVMTDLEKNRRGSEIFAGKSGFITLRDLFRWGDRFRLSKDNDTFDDYHDWQKHLAQIGFMILAGRVRKEDEVITIKTVLEKHFLKNKETLDIDEFFDDKFTEICQSGCLDPQNKYGFGGVASTSNLKRLVVLLWNALKYKEPILLVGETGCGKTTVCQIYAALHSMILSTVNCHMHSEGSDFLGSLRPVRDGVGTDGKLFEWVDGPLVRAMNEGHMFLLDEISLADDSVLERLNSVLEPEKTLLLSEKGGDVGQDNPVIVAHPSFLLVATMNPGGDYGKKELSPALRNRFTEIWCPSSSNSKDLTQIILQNLKTEFDEKMRIAVTEVISSFYFWFRETVFAPRSVSSLRDILSWIEFINTTTEMDGQTSLSLEEAIIHGAQLVFIDAIGCGGFHASEDSQKAADVKSKCLTWLSQVVKNSLGFSRKETSCAITLTDTSFGVGNFFIDVKKSSSEKTRDFTFECGGVKKNCLKVLRAMQLQKPILLEGVPGVGKTTLVQALAKQTGREVVRINLSEQTDISDLFGGDFPVETDNSIEGTKGGQFRWRDGPLLQALKSNNTWIILDELNLASQSVLEGLNACLDHRGEVFISELGKVFKVNKNQTRFFACQNPYGQGGARKGLPKSFLNRFTMVFVDAFSDDDLIEITSEIFPAITKTIVKKLVRFNQLIVSKIEKRELGSTGSPWELNLRDVSRCCSLISTLNPEDVPLNVLLTSVCNVVSQVYINRFRSQTDRQEIKNLFRVVFGIPLNDSPDMIFMSPEIMESGKGISLQRQNLVSFPRRCLYLDPEKNSIISSLMACIKMNWMSILVASHAQNPDTLVECLASLCGRQLKNLNVNSEMDAIELLGGFEKKDLLRQMNVFEEDIFRIIRDVGKKDTAVLNSWYSYCDIKLQVDGSLDEIEHLQSRIHALISIVTSLGSDSEAIPIKEKLETLSRDVSKSTDLAGGGSFEWIDSVLVKAMKEGHWILLQDVNLCPASVLDRLNSLFEPNGCLILSEQGSVGSRGIPIIKPHPDFRLFMTMDPKYGELSRAMRNRGIEIFVPYIEDEEGSSIPLDVTCLVGDCTHAKVLVELLMTEAFITKNNEQYVEPVAFRIFLSRSSLSDLELRRSLIPSYLGDLGEIFLKADCKALAVTTHRPFDNRMLFEEDPQRLGLLNNYGYQLWKFFHKGVPVTSNFLPTTLSDRQFFHLRYFSQIFCDLDQNKDAIGILQQKFLLLLKEHFSITDKVDPKASLFLKWSETVRKLAPTLPYPELWEKLNENDLVLRWMTMHPHAPDFKETTDDFIKFGNALSVGTKMSFETISKMFSQKNNPCDIEEDLVAQLLFALISDNFITESSLSAFLSNVTYEGFLNREICFRPLHVLMIHKPENTILSGRIAQYLSFLPSSRERVLVSLEESRRAPLGSVPATSDLFNVTSRLLGQRSILSSFGEKRDFLTSLSKTLSVSLTLNIKDPNERLTHILDSWNEVVGREMLLLQGNKKRSRHPSLGISSENLKRFVELGFRSIDEGLSTIKIFVPTSHVDPFEIGVIERSHLINLRLISSLEAMAIEMFGRLDVDSSSQTCHPYLPLLEKSIKEIDRMIEVNLDGRRPRLSSYESLRELASSLEKWILKKVPEVKTTVAKSINSWDYTKYWEVENIRKNIRNNIDKLMYNYVDFYDILYPFIVGVIFVEQGINRLCLAMSVIESVGLNKQYLGFADEVTRSFGNFFNSDLVSPTDVICGSSHFFSRLVHITSSHNSFNLLAKTILSALIDLKNLKSLASKEYPTRILIDKAKPLFDLFMNSWTKKREEEKAKQELDDALVHFRPREETQDEQIEIMKRFPSFRHEFKDLGTKYDNEDMCANVSTVDNLIKDERVVLKLIEVYKDLVESKNLEADLWTPMKYKHDLTSFLLQKIPVEFITVKETDIMPLQLFAIIQENCSRERLEDRSSRSDFNIYFNNCPSQMLKCYSVLKPFQERLKALLEEIEDHPTLMKLRGILKRIMSFDVESPLMKFLTGLELLWEESQEWEKVYAHREIKITAEIDSLKEVIVSWRKIELSNWSTCLDHISKSHQERDLIQWWFHFFNLLEEDSESSNAVIHALKQFIEGSTIGVYSTRIELMKVFCLVASIKDMGEKFNILHNITSFYFQFLSPVTAQLLADRKPIEKDVKDLVKITTFKDMNDWCLKATIDSAHKKLNRHMKKFELMINKPVSPFLSVNFSERLLKTEASLNLDIVKFLIVSTNEVDDSKASLPSDLVSKMPVIRKNLKKFSKNIVLSFSTIVESINEQKEAIEQLWETSQGLKDSKLELKSADAEERKKAVHHMSNRKRATLSQLFKNQMASGLSWSKGINFFREFDINRVFSETCPLRLDDSYIEVSCNELFFGNLALFSQLQIAIATPSKELTSIMLDRIKGISGHAMQLTVSHRQELSRVVSLVREFQKSFDNLFKKRLSSDRSTQHVRLFVVVEKAHFILSNFDETYESVLGPLSSDSFSLSDAKDALSIARNVLSSQSLDEQSLLEVNKSLMEVFPEKSAIYEELSRIMDSFEKEDHDEQQENYLIQKSLYNNLITRSMKSVEKLLKSSNEVKEESGSHSRFLDVLSLQSIICSQDQDIKHLLDNLRSFKDPHDQSLSIIEPFVMQYLNLLKYFVTIFTAAQRTFGQKLQILLDLFVHLSQKGFSIPPDVLQEEKDGGTKDLTGTGLDDGEGEAAEDISSRIDNEDQLEDTMRDGEEKNNHENNVDQEEKGIDMDGDFEGRNYDMENDDKEGGDDKKSDGEDEMGDNDRDEGTSYDKKLWEFEDDQGDEEEEMDESGEDGKGEETGEDKIVAAEGVKGEKDDNDQGEEKKTQESNEINENEMDDEYEGEREDTTKTDDKQQKGNETNDFDLPEELDLHEDMPSDGEESGDNGSVMSEDINKELSEGGNITDDEMKDDESMEMDNEGEKSSKEVDPMEKAEEEHSNEDETMKDVLNSLDDVKAPEAIPTEYDDKNQENSATNKEQQKNLSNENERSTDSKESEGVGEAQLDEDEDGHHTTQAAKSSASQEGRKQQKNPSTAKQSNDTRSLGTENDSHTKKQKILPVTSEAEQDTQSESLKESSDYQHVADNNIADENIIDSAARDEAKNVRNLKEEDETKEEHGVEDSDDDAPMEESLKESIKLDQDLPKKSKSEKDKPNSKEELTTNEMMVEGEAIQTSFVERGPASMFATNPEYLTKSGNLDWTKVITQVTKFHLNPDPESYAAASVLWDECCHRVSPLVFELCQQLQLVLEPSKCSKLKGDYRTGKRINMRKVIPYIASQFRKDKIWLRRSKPSKRSYQIILAVDDSQSMADNELKIMAFESLALLSKSLSLVEAGQMAVMSFGEETKLLHSLEDPFSDASGSRILTGFSFDQKKTRIDCLLNSASSIFLSSKSSAQSSNDISQLMIIISDGRGLFSEGEERVTQKIRQLNDAGVFCVFVILDTGKTSIFEHKTVSFLNGGVQTEYYMDHFPFPFYVVLKDVNNIPSILGESLRQWFELITQHK